MRTFKAILRQFLPIIALFLLCSSYVQSQGWERKFGPGYPHSIQTSPDGSSWLFYTNNDLYVQHVAANGDSLGCVHLGWSGAEVWPVAGGFIKAGKRGGWYGLDSLAVEKRSATGQTIWKRHFGDTVMLGGLALAPTADGQYLVASLPQRVVGQPFPAMTKWLSLRRLSATGTVLWQKTYSGDLAFLTGVSLRQMVLLADGSAVLLLNVSYSGDDRSYRLWKFDSNGNFLEELSVEAETSFTSGYSLNVDAENNLLLASEWSGDGGHHAVWRTLAGGTNVQFQKTVAAKPGGNGSYHHPAPLAMVQLECGRYLTLLHLTNFTLEAWSPAGERLWEHPVPGPASPGYYTPAYPPARFGSFLQPTADGGALAAVPDNGRIRLLKIDCSGKTSASGALVNGQVVYDNNSNCQPDSEEPGFPNMAFDVHRSGEPSAVIWADEQGHFTLPLDTGAWIVQPIATTPLPEPSPGCSFVSSLLIDGSTETFASNFMLASQVSPTSSAPAATSWSVYPNPVDDRLVLQRAEGSGPVMVTVWTTQGQLVFSGRPQAESDHAWVVPAGAWLPGVYNIRVESQQRPSQFKVVKVGQ